MPGITSYAHLNEIIITVLKENGGQMTAHQINDAIITRYKIGKVRINPLRIAKRLTGNESIEATYGKKGLFVYKYKK